MTKRLLMATTALLFAAPALAAAQTAAPNAAPASASASSEGAGVLVFTPDFFAGQRPNTALDMVSRVPGFSVNDGSGARGFEGAVGNILINNARPASKNDTGSNVLGRTLAAQVERIELIRGGAPGIDMQGYSVVANVILKSESSRQSIVTLHTNQFEGRGKDLYSGTYQFTAREGDRSWGVTLSDGISMSDSNGPGWLVRRAPDGTVLRDERTENDGYGGSNSIRGTYAGPFMGGKVDVTARYGINDWNGYNISESTVALRESRSGEDVEGGEFGVTWERPLGDRYKLETRFMHEFDSWDGAQTYNVALNGTPNPEQVFAYSGSSSETILRGIIRHEPTPKVTIEAGAEIAYNMRETDQALTEGGVPVELTGASVKVEETRGELFSKTTYRVNPDLTVEAGLRLEASTISQSGDSQSEKSLFFAKPRFLASWTPMPDNQLRFRFERELGQLDFSDFAASADLDEENVSGGNIDLEPEQRWISELIYERRFWGEGIVSVGYRHDEIIDAIDYLPLSPTVSAIGNIGDGTLDRLSLNVVLPLDRIGFSGGRFTFRNDWNKARVTDPTTGEERPISGVRASQANVGVQQDIKTWKLQWGVNVLPRLGQGTYRPNQTFTWRGAGYVEMFAEYKPTPTLSLRAQLNVWDDFTQRRIQYDGNTRDILYTEDSAVDPRTFVSLRLRKTF